jgi:hypothetical protein
VGDRPGALFNIEQFWAKMENILSSSKFNGKLVHFKLITLCVNRPLPTLFVVYPQALQFAA